jgi:hypothetical protein
VDTITITILSKDSQLIDTVFDGIIPKGTKIYEWNVPINTINDTFIARLSGNFASRYILIYESISNSIDDFKPVEYKSQQFYYLMNNELVFDMDNIQLFTITSITGLLIYNQLRTGFNNQTILLPKGMYIISMVLNMPYQNQQILQQKIVIK